MKCFCLLLCLCALLCPLWGNETVHLIASFDLSALDALWRSHVELRAAFEMRSELGVGISIPLVLLLDRSGGGEALFETAVKLVCLPWSDGPFIALSLAQIDLFVGPSVPQHTYHYLSEIEFGYSWEFLPRFYVMGSLIYRDPGDASVDSYSYIYSFLPTFSKLKASFE
ncbi:MAG: hypothetical protein ACOXZ4_02175 [Sphaerochaetaceae bacterium]